MISAESESGPRTARTDGEAQVIRPASSIRVTTSRTFSLMTSSETCAWTEVVTSTAWARTAGSRPAVGVEQAERHVQPAAGGRPLDPRHGHGLVAQGGERLAPCGRGLPPAPTRSRSGPRARPPRVWTRSSMARLAHSRVPSGPMTAVPTAAAACARGTHAGTPACSQQGVRVTRRAGWLPRGHSRTGADRARRCGTRGRRAALTGSAPRGHAGRDRALRGPGRSPHARAERHRSGACPTAPRRRP